VCPALLADEILTSALSSYESEITNAAIINIIIIIIIVVIVCISVKIQVLQLSQHSLML